MKIPAGNEGVPEVDSDALVLKSFSSCFQVLFHAEEFFPLAVNPAEELDDSDYFLDADN